MTTSRTQLTVTLATNQKAALYIRQAGVHQTRLGNDLRKLYTELLLTFAHEMGWPDDLIIIVNDSDIPASAPLEKREGLQQLIRAIEQDEVKAVLLNIEHSLYRNATLVAIAIFMEQCKRHGVCVATPELVYDVSNPMHERLFRLSLESQTFFIYARTNG